MEHACVPLLLQGMSLSVALGCGHEIAMCKMQEMQGNAMQADSMQAKNAMHCLHLPCYLSLRSAVACISPTFDCQAQDGNPMQGKAIL
jgi:hypothetical protein